MRTVGNRAALTLQPDAWVDALFTGRAAHMQEGVDALRGALAAVALREGETQRGALQRVSMLSEGIAYEVFASMYGDTEQAAVPAPDTQFVSQVLEAVSASESTRNDADISAVCTNRLLIKVAPTLAALKLAQKADSDDTESELAADRAAAVINNAVDEAEQEASDVAALLVSVCPTMGHIPENQREASDRLTLAKMLAENEEFRKVIELAGRMRRTASADRKVESTNARSKVVGIERGNNLSRALPAEIAMLGHPALKVLAVAKFANRGMAQFRLGGREPQGRGPVVVLIDESGSMMHTARSGFTRQQFAAAAAVAVLGMCLREKRACTVLGFDTRVRWCHSVDESGSCDDFGNVSQLVTKILSSGLGGGTSFAPAIQYAIDHERGVTNERSDLVLITDGYADIPRSMTETLDESRKNGMRLYALTVGGGSLSAAVQSLAHEVLDIDTSSDKELAHALA